VKLKLEKIQAFAMVALLMSITFHAQSLKAETPPPEYPVGMEVTKVNNPIALYHTITVEVEKLDEFLNQPGTDPANFVLYLNWRPLKGLKVKKVDGHKMLMFDIRRTEESKEEWDALLGRPFYGGKGFSYQLPVSVGYQNKLPINTKANGTLVLINFVGFVIFAVLFVLILYLFWWLAKKKGIIRDPCPDLPVSERPYSLGKTQMAFWFFLIAVSYFLIWMITSNPESLTSEALALLGISTATALGAAVIGSSKSNNAETKQKDLEQERDTLIKRLALITEEKKTVSEDKLTELNKEEAEKTARKAQVEKELATAETQLTPQKSESFLTDIVSDNDGISLHRFQIVIWTIVLGVIFVASVYNTLAMPKFSPTLLALLGISGGTYIGFKFPEKT
jgi:ABC-type multidrug transport system fused ATPase/permease subunit